MYVYSPVQWLLFFFCYCFIGWIWESCYVSLKEKKYINRGFLHGPVLPIYGFGAIIILFVTLPVKDNLVLVFICGLVGATVLEFITGAVMEKMFHMRYWDYSNIPFNLNGYICLYTSVGWGVFSVLMIRIIHRPVERLVVNIPMTMAEILALLISITISIDTTVSFNEAMNFKKMLINIAANNEEVKKLQRRINMVAALINYDAQELLEKLDERQRVITFEKISDVAGGYFDEMSNKLIEKKKELAEEFDKVKVEIELIKDKIKLQELFPGRKKDELYHSIRLLKRNPGIVSKRYKQALKEILGVGENKKSKEELEEEKSDDEKNSLM